MAIPREPNPYDLFDQWYTEALACKEIDDATAMVLSTVDEAGHPDSRVVLLKHHDPHGFVFYTNLGSMKSRQLEKCPHASLCFYWMPLEKQVRIRGTVTPVPDDEADTYFATRPRESQIGAWASKQSEPLEKWFELERRIAKYTMKYGLGKVPRPPFWSGFRVTPESIEFWLKRPFRLHERLLYERAENGWTMQGLFP